MDRGDSVNLILKNISLHGTSHKTTVMFFWMGSTGFCYCKVFSINEPYFKDVFQSILHLAIQIHT